MVVVFSTSFFALSLIISPLMSASCSINFFSSLDPENPSLSSENKFLKFLTSS